MQTLQVRGNDVVSGHTQGFYHFKVQDVGAVMVNVVADGADSRLSTCTLANSRPWTTQRSSCGRGKKHRRLGFQGRRAPSRMSLTAPTSLLLPLPRQTLFMEARFFMSSAEDISAKTPSSFPLVLLCKEKLPLTIIF